jgi:hypothetical protein
LNNNIVFPMVLYATGVIPNCLQFTICLSYRCIVNMMWYAIFNDCILQLLILAARFNVITQLERSQVHTRTNQRLWKPLTVSASYWPIIRLPCSFADVCCNPCNLFDEILGSSRMLCCFPSLFLFSLILIPNQRYFSSPVLWLAVFRF